MYLRELPGLRDLNGVLLALAVLTSIWVVVGVARIVRWRMYMRKLGSQGLPMPPHSFLFGHFPLILRTIGKLPKDAHPAYFTDEIRREYPELEPNFYLDLVPFADPLLVIGSTDAHYQISQEHLLEKTDVLKQFIRPLTEGLDFLTMEYARWKKWRGLFNPGFSAAHLMTLVPAIAKETEKFTQILEEHAKESKPVALKGLTDYLALDVIGQVALGTQFDCQRNKIQAMESLRMQIRWFVLKLEPNLFTRYNPAQYVVQWYHGRIVNAYISAKFDERVQALNEEVKSESSRKRPRTIIDLVLSANSETGAGGRAKGGPLVVDPTFKRMCMSQIKLFLFGGHDTTSSSICYQILLLSRHPEVLRRIRAEHLRVFGPNPKEAGQAIASSPHLLNDLPITTAVIKESLRLFPPVTVSRTGEKEYSIKDSQGRLYPTGDFTVFPHTHMIHHDPIYWPEPMSFNPDRWLVGPGDPLYPIKGAWRGFEHGPRNCIGQELAMLEMKIVLVMVSRRFAFHAAYDEVDKEAGRVNAAIHGEKAYQVDALRPRDDLPVRIEMLTS